MRNSGSGAGKRGQVTIFIFIGIFILIIAGVFFYFRSELILDRFEDKPGLSEQFRGVREHYEECLMNIAREGINVVGSQGGQLNVDENAGNAGNADGYIDVFNDNSVKVPYWGYRKNNNVEVVDVPSLNNVEENVEKYIENNLGRCFEEGRVLEDYNLREYGKLKPEVDIGDEKVFVRIESPLNVEFKDVTETIEGLQVIVDVPFGRMYRTALDLFEREQKEMFLEERTLDYMGLYDEIPFSGADLDCGGKRWSEDDVERDFKQIINYNLPLLVTNEKNIDDKYRKVDVNGNGLDVGFRYYEDWPFYMAVEPSENGVLKSDNAMGGVMGAIAGLFCFQKYHFVYDVKYPVLVTISDNGGSVFQFGVQIVIENNAARTISYNVEVIDSGNGICGNDNGLLNVNVYRFGNDGNLLRTDAMLSMKCLNEVCGLGESYNGGFIGKVPACSNALIIGEKEGYYRGKQMMSTNLGEVGSLILEPVYNRQLEVKLIGNVGNLKEVNEENVLLEFIGEDYSYSVNYPSERNVKLIAGEYNVKAYVFGKSKNGFKVNARTSRTCVNVPGFLGLYNKQECYDVDVGEVDVGDVLIGGGEFEFNVERDEIVNSNKLIVYLIADDVPRDYNEIFNAGEKLKYNNLDARFKQPEFTR